ncbi:hypothetical protein HPC49_00230 [Pyxidicoccus fallax]|nr:hypothetical protein [Pyxidicoccus fallax]NPC76681.1 hypothetical protein [Pyxidicoccus fallax]
MKRSKAVLVCLAVSALGFLGPASSGFILDWLPNSPGPRDGFFTVIGLIVGAALAPMALGVSLLVLFLIELTRSRHT